MHCRARLWYPECMSFQEYMHWMRTGTPNHWSYEIVAKPYKNAEGVDEIISMMRCNWDYVDWLEANSEIKFAEWVIHCDKNPWENMCLSNLLMYWLWLDECNRFKEGLPTPNAYPPMGYVGWGEKTATTSK